MKTRSPAWLRCLALAASLLGAAPAAIAGIDDGEGIIPADQPILLGPHSVLIVDEAGNAIMYEDPSGREPACVDAVACVGILPDAPGGQRLYEPPPPASAPPSSAAASEPGSTPSGTSLAH